MQKKWRIPLFLLAGGRGFEPLHTDPESVVLPLDEPPLHASLSYSDFIVQGIFREMLCAFIYSSRSLIASSSLLITFTLPIISIDSNKGGLTIRPVTATRNIPNTFPGL